MTRKRKPIRRRDPNLRVEVHDREELREDVVVQKTRKVERQVLDEDKDQIGPNPRTVSSRVSP